MSSATDHLLHAILRDGSAWLDYRMVLSCGITLLSRRGAEAEFSVLAEDEPAPVIDNRPKLAARLPETRHYRAILRYRAPCHRPELNHALHPGTAMKPKFIYPRGQLARILLGLCLPVLPVRAAPGDLDTAFGTGGMASASFDSGSYGQAFNVAVQHDGKIVVAGHTLNAGTHDFLLVRFTPDGALDAGFGAGGRVTTDFGGGQDLGRCLGLQADGKIIVGGYTTDVTGGNDLALARYNTDGGLDSGFGKGGKVATDIRGTWGIDSARSIAFQSDGKIVVAGHSALSSGDMDFALLRYNPDGSLDTAFGTGGVTITDIDEDYADSWDYARSVAIQRDGRIIVAGLTSDDSPSESSRARPALVRYYSNGSLDPTFGSGGITTTDLQEIDSTSSSTHHEALGVAVQADGKIVVTTVSDNGWDSGCTSLLRYFSDGRLDNGFGTVGFVRTACGSALTGSMVLQRNGKIVAPGSGATSALRRYTQNGAPDTAFGNNGMATVAPDRWPAYARAVALQRDGKIVLAGASSRFGSGQLQVLRFMGDPELTLEPTWFESDADDGGGEYILLGAAPPGGPAAVRTVTVQNAGSSDLMLDSLSVSGTAAADFSLNTTGMVASLSPNGSTSFTIAFSPDSDGVRYATLSVFSNDSAPGPLDVQLAGGLTPSEIWHFKWFGWHTGGSYLADPNGNGIVNLMEYALAGDPVGNTTGRSILPQVAAGPDNALRFTFTRWLDRTDLTLTISAADAPGGPWIPIARSTVGTPFFALTPGAGITEVGEGSSRSVTVTDIYSVNSPGHPKRFMRLEVAR